MMSLYVYYFKTPRDFVVDSLFTDTAGTGLLLSVPVITELGGEDTVYRCVPATGH